MRKRQGDAGFTLVELLVVMVIIGVLSAIALPAMAGQTRKGKLTAMKSALRAAQSTEEQLIADDKDYAAPGDAGLTALLAAGYVASPTVVLTVLAGGHRYCLRAQHTALAPADALYLASDGPRAGRPTPVPCA